VRMRRTNALLVVDDEEPSMCPEFLLVLDKLGKTARSRVRFGRVRVRERTTSRQGPVPQERIGRSARANDEKERGGVRVQDRSRSQQGEFGIFVTVVSGSAAYYHGGQDIVYTERWVDLTRRYARFTESVTIQRIETGFESDALSF